MPKLAPRALTGSKVLALVMSNVVISLAFWVSVGITEDAMVALLERNR